ncbi:unnamed protein product [Amoebophrya sp. A25]|nr:unnamed protein product [Amoebophrya sp. A25]|eukprot:GSA25T00021893001.1
MPTNYTNVRPKTIGAKRWPDHSLASRGSSQEGVDCKGVESLSVADFEVVSSTTISQEHGYLRRKDSTTGTTGSLKSPERNQQARESQGDHVVGKKSAAEALVTDLQPEVEAAANDKVLADEPKGADEDDRVNITASDEVEPRTSSSCSVSTEVLPQLHSQEEQTQEQTRQVKTSFSSRATSPNTKKQQQGEEEEEESPSSTPKSSGRPAKSPKKTKKNRTRRPAIKEKRIRTKDDKEIHSAIQDPAKEVEVETLQEVTSGQSVREVRIYPKKKNSSRGKSLSSLLSGESHEHLDEECLAQQAQEDETLVQDEESASSSWAGEHIMTTTTITPSQHRPRGQDFAAMTPASSSKSGFAPYPRNSTSEQMGTSTYTYAAAEDDLHRHASSGATSSSGTSSDSPRKRNHSTNSKGGFHNKHRGSSKNKGASRTTLSTSSSPLGGPVAVQWSSSSGRAAVGSAPAGGSSFSLGVFGRQDSTTPSSSTSRYGGEQQQHHSATAAGGHMTAAHNTAPYDSTRRNDSTTLGQLGGLLTQPHQAPSPSTTVQGILNLTDQQQRQGILDLLQKSVKTTASSTLAGLPGSLGNDQHVAELPSDSTDPLIVNAHAALLKGQLVKFAQQQAANGGGPLIPPAQLQQQLVNNLGASTALLNSLSSSGGGVGGGLGDNISSGGVGNNLLNDLAKSAALLQGAGGNSQIPLFGETTPGGGGSSSSSSSGVPASTSCDLGGGQPQLGGLQLAAPGGIHPGGGGAAPVGASRKPRTPAPQLSPTGRMMEQLIAHDPLNLSEVHPDRPSAPELPWKETLGTTRDAIEIRRDQNDVNWFVYPPGHAAIPETATTSADNLKCTPICWGHLLTTQEEGGEECEGEGEEDHIREDLSGGGTISRQASGYGESGATPPVAEAGTTSRVDQQRSSSVIIENSPAGRGASSAVRGSPANKGSFVSMGSTTGATGTNNLGLGAQLLAAQAQQGQFLRQLSQQGTPQTNPLSSNPLSMATALLLQQMQQLAASSTNTNMTTTATSTPFLPGGPSSATPSSSTCSGRPPLAPEPLLTSSSSSSEHLHQRGGVRTVDLQRLADAVMEHSPSKKIAAARRAEGSTSSTPHSCMQQLQGSVNNTTNNSSCLVLNTSCSRSSSSTSGPCFNTSSTPGGQLLGGVGLGDCIHPSPACSSKSALEQRQLNALLAEAAMQGAGLLQLPSSNTATSSGTPGGSMHITSGMNMMQPTSSSTTCTSGQLTSALGVQSSQQEEHLHQLEQHQQGGVGTTVMASSSTASMTTALRLSPLMMNSTAALQGLGLLSGQAHSEAIRAQQQAFQLANSKGAIPIYFLGKSGGGGKSSTFSKEGKDYGKGGHYQQDKGQHTGQYPAHHLPESGEEMPSSCFATNGPVLMGAAAATEKYRGILAGASKSGLLGSANSALPNSLSGEFRLPNSLTGTPILGTTHAGDHHLTASAARTSASSSVASTGGATTPITSSKRGSKKGDIGLGFGFPPRGGEYKGAEYKKGGDYNTNTHSTSNVDFVKGAEHNFSGDQGGKPIKGGKGKGKKGAIKGLNKDGDQLQHLGGGKSQPQHKGKNTSEFSTSTSQQNPAKGKTHQLDLKGAGRQLPPTGPRHFGKQGGTTSTAHQHQTGPTGPTSRQGPSSTLRGAAATTGAAVHLQHPHPIVIPGILGGSASGAAILSSTPQAGSIHFPMMQGVGDRSHFLCYGAPYAMSFARAGQVSVGPNGRPVFAAPVASDGQAGGPTHVVMVAADNRSLLGGQNRETAPPPFYPDTEEALDAELHDFLEEIKMSRREKVARRKWVSKLEALVRERMDPEVKVSLFGSMASDLALYSADVDMCVTFSKDALDNVKKRKRSWSSDDHSKDAGGSASPAPSSYTTPSLSEEPEVTPVVDNSGGAAAIEDKKEKDETTSSSSSTDQEAVASLGIKESAEMTMRSSTSTTARGASSSSASSSSAEAGEVVAEKKDEVVVPSQDPENKEQEEGPPTTKKTKKSAANAQKKNSAENGEQDGDHNPKLEAATTAMLMKVMKREIEKAMGPKEIAFMQQINTATMPVMKIHTTTGIATDIVFNSEGVRSTNWIRREMEVFTCGYKLFRDQRRQFLLENGVSNTVGDGARLGESGQLSLGEDLAVGDSSSTVAKDKESPTFDGGLSTSTQQQQQEHVPFVGTSGDNSAPTAGDPYAATRTGIIRPYTKWRLGGRGCASGEYDDASDAEQKNDVKTEGAAPLNQAEKIDQAAIVEAENTSSSSLVVQETPDELQAGGVEPLEVEKNPSLGSPLADALKMGAVGEQKITVLRRPSSHTGGNSSFSNSSSSTTLGETASASGSASGSSNICELVLDHLVPVPSSAQGGDVLEKSDAKPDGVAGAAVFSSACFGTSTPSTTAASSSIVLGELPAKIILRKNSSAESQEKEMNLLPVGEQQQCTPTPSSSSASATPGDATIKLGLTNVVSNVTSSVLHDLGHLGGSPTHGLRSSSSSSCSTPERPRNIARQLVLFTKFLLNWHNLHETFSGGCGSFLLGILVVHFLRERVHASAKLRGAQGAATSHSATASACMSEPGSGILALSATSGTGMLQKVQKSLIAEQPSPIESEQAIADVNVRKDDDVREQANGNATSSSSSSYSNVADGLQQDKSSVAKTSASNTVTTLAATSTGSPTPGVEQVEAGSGVVTSSSASSSASSSSSSSSRDRYHSSSTAPTLTTATGNTNTMEKPFQDMQEDVLNLNLGVVGGGQLRFDLPSPVEGLGNRQGMQLHHSSSSPTSTRTGKARAAKNNSPVKGATSSRPPAAGCRMHARGCSSINSSPTVGGCGASSVASGLAEDYVQRQNEYASLFENVTTLRLLLEFFTYYSRYASTVPIEIQMPSKKKLKRAKLEKDQGSEWGRTTAVSSPALNKNTGVTTTPAGLSGYLSVISPVDGVTDLGAKCFRWTQIKTLFAHCAATIREALASAPHIKGSLAEASIIASIFPEMELRRTLDCRSSSHVKPALGGNSSNKKNRGGGGGNARGSSPAKSGSKTGSKTQQATLATVGGPLTTGSEQFFRGFVSSKETRNSSTQGVATSKKQMQTSGGASSANKGQGKQQGGQQGGGPKMKNAKQTPKQTPKQPGTHPNKLQSCGGDLSSLPPALPSSSSSTSAQAKAKAASASENNKKKAATPSSSTSKDQLAAEQKTRTTTSSSSLSSASASQPQGGANTSASCNLGGAISTNNTNGNTEDLQQDLLFVETPTSEQMMGSVASNASTPNPGRESTSSSKSSKRSHVNSCLNLAPASTTGVLKAPKRATWVRKNSRNFSDSGRSSSKDAASNFGGTSSEAEQTVQPVEPTSIQPGVVGTTSTSSSATPLVSRRKDSSGSKTGSNHKRDCKQNCSKTGSNCKAPSPSESPVNPGSGKPKIKKFHHQGGEDKTSPSGGSPKSGLK